MHYKATGLLDNIIEDLKDNYDSSDKLVLTNILEDVIAQALFISNRVNNEDNIRVLKPEIIECTKTLYLQRGSEDVLSHSENGTSSSFKNAYEILRKSIINNGKRVIK